MSRSPRASRIAVWTRGTRVLPPKRMTEVMVSRGMPAAKSAEGMGEEKSERDEAVADSRSARRRRER
jgi:hypothetical protein